MKTSEFNYHLPPEQIAQTPIEPRDASRLLVVHRTPGLIEHRHFRDLHAYLMPGDLLVANDSRVIPARLFGHKLPTGGKVEMLLLNRRDGETWEVLLKPGRRVRPGARIAIDPPPGAALADPTERPEEVIAEVIGATGAGGRLLAFSSPVDKLLPRLGVVPLPPYIHTPLPNSERYQTVYARIQGSVAAPTAGLHFTPALIKRLEGMGVEFAFVTLHVSMDTFRPVQEAEVSDHHMYTEYCELSAEGAAALNAARAAGRRVVAVGTTTVRVLETAALRAGSGGAPLVPVAGPTDLFIYPGFNFRVVEALITNFHLPRSTLLLLVSAFAGKELVDRAYAEAICAGYRFYSFGDAMLIL